jgi:hypothetical protein
MKWAIHDPNYIWILCEVDKNIIGSVIFVVDQKHHLGKTFAGVVLPDFRGRKVMKTAIQMGIKCLFEENNHCDAIYGVVRTFVTRGFHDDLEDLGFRDMGIFPNVRKISKYETHGLKVLYKGGAPQGRKKPPVLIEPCRAIYDIAKDRLCLEEAEVYDYKYKTPSGLPGFKLLVEKSPDIEWEYYKKRDQGELDLSVFPFHYPLIKLYTEDQKNIAYIHFEEKDGHGDIMGIKIEQPEMLTGLLESVANLAESIGIKYLEVLIDAYNPIRQIQVYEADFIPCAYFPGITVDEDNLRRDVVVASRTFVPLDFRGLKLTDGARPFIRAYYKLRSTKLWEDLEHA